MCEIFNVEEMFPPFPCLWDPLVEPLLSFLSSPSLLDTAAPFSEWEGEEGGGGEGEGIGLLKGGFYCNTLKYHKQPLVNTPPPPSPHTHTHHTHTYKPWTLLCNSM